MDIIRKLQDIRDPALPAEKREGCAWYAIHLSNRCSALNRSIKLVETQ